MLPSDVIKNHAEQNKEYQFSYSLVELTAGLDVVIQGDPTCIITGVNTIQNATQGHITFLTNSLYKKYLAETKASAVIVLPTEASLCQTNAIISKNPHLTYAKIAHFFLPKQKILSGIHPSAIVGEFCEIDASAYIGPNCVLENYVKVGPRTQIKAGSYLGASVTIGADSLLDANVTIHHHCAIGVRTTIASGVVIGSTGFGFANDKGTWHKVPQLGAVLIGDNVDIGANTTIDRGAIGDTIIENGVKLDNLIQVGHNVRIGENTIIAGCVGISGSASIGKNCMIGGATGIAGHITICDNVVITGMTAVSRSILNPNIYSSGLGGLMTNQEWRKTSGRVHRLEHWINRLKNLESAFKELKERE